MSLKKSAELKHEWEVTSFALHKQSPPLPSGVHNSKRATLAKYDSTTAQRPGYFTREHQLYTLSSNVCVRIDAWKI